MTRTFNDLQVDVESAFVLLELVGAGDSRALDRLFTRTSMRFSRTGKAHCSPTFVRRS
jgi:hypothetical protein